MPRNPPRVRSDGEAVGTDFANRKQPNGQRLPQTASVGVGATEPYGQGTALKNAIAATPTPPADPAEVIANHFNHHDFTRTKLQMRTQRPYEPVTAGAPLGPGPTNPMAMPQNPISSLSVASVLSQAAQATNDPTLTALAQRAAAISGGQPPTP